MKIFTGIAAAMVLTAAAMAQAPKAPAVTEVERLKLENISLKMSQLQQQYTQLDQEKQAVVAEITKDNPGYHWASDPRSGQEGLVADAAPVATKPTVNAPVKK